MAGAQRAGGDTGFCVALIEPDGERTFVTVPGVEAAADPRTTWPRVPATPRTSSRSPATTCSTRAAVRYWPTWIGDLPAHVRVALDPGPLVCDIPTERLAGGAGRGWRC